MKIILSRKGCDSSFGGIPGILLPDNRIVYIPIPGDAYEPITYHEVNAQNGFGNLSDTIRQVSPFLKMHGSKFPITADTKCHLDPDLSYDLYPRKDGWQGCFGQADAAQTVLENAGVKKDDLFLFFGWFRRTYYKDGKLNYCKEQGIHMIFGWLQIEQMLYPHQMPVPEWLKYHPHVIENRIKKKKNCIYIGSNQTTWNSSLKGYGLFPKATDTLILTKKGMSRSKWNLPETFRKVPLTYHTGASWKNGYFQSARRGQEFVFAESDAVRNWACKLVEENQ